MKAYHDTYGGGMHILVLSQYIFRSAVLLNSPHLNAVRPPTGHLHDEAFVPDPQGFGIHTSIKLSDHAFYHYIRLLGRMSLDAEIPLMRFFALHDSQNSNNSGPSEYSKLEQWTKEWQGQDWKLYPSLTHWSSKEDT